MSSTTKKKGVSKYKNAFLFKDADNIDYQKSEKMRKYVKEKGGMLHFKVEFHKQGWTARCEEFPAIVTGSDDPSPSQTEIESQMREAIFAAFDLYKTSAKEGGDKDNEDITLVEKVVFTTV